MKDFKESGLYFLLAIIAAAGVLGAFFLIPANALKAALVVVLSIGIIIGFCAFLRIFDGVIKYPLKSTFLDDLNEKDKRR